MESLESQMNNIHKIIDRETESWFNSQCNNVNAHFHVYYKPGDIKISDEMPNGYDLAMNERLSPGWTIAQARYRIKEIIKKLPILKP